MSDILEKKERFMQSLCVRISAEFDTYARAFVHSLSEEQQKEYNTAASVTTLLVELVGMLNSGLLKVFLKNLSLENLSPDEADKKRETAFNLATESLIEFLQMEKYERT